MPATTAINYMPNYPDILKMCTSVNKKWCRSKERGKALDKIRLMGDYHHNAKVVSCGKGQLIIKKRPSKDEITEAKDYLPCSYCFGFYKKHDLWRHCKTCAFKEKEAEGKRTYNFIGESRRLLIPYICPNASKMLQEVISKMKDDDITFRCKHDNLIIMFGSSIIDKVGKRKSAYVSQRMRQLSRLLAVLNEEKDCKLADVINPSSFDLVVIAVKKLLPIYKG